MELGRVRALLSAQQSYKVEHIRIGNHFVPTRAAAPLSSRLNRPNDSQESLRIRQRGQARFAHTCDSFSESLKRHLCLRHRHLSADVQRDTTVGEACPARLSGRDGPVRGRCLAGRATVFLGQPP
jgi:hypothetical protein